jgi:hypothetical protein
LIDRAVPAITTGDDMENEDDHQPEAAARPSRRFRWTVPPADESVLRWVELQDNVSLSLRLLVREFIAREGYVDPMNRPVEHQPRRDRSPVASDQSRHGADDPIQLEPASGTPVPTEARTSPGHGGQVSIDEIMASTRR